MTICKNKFISLSLLLTIGILMSRSLDPLLAQSPIPEVSTPQQIEEDIKRVPCKNDERLGAVRSLFERAGASDSDITIDKYKGVENLVITKKGDSDEKIVVGAHYDKVLDGCGAVDNWTGIVAMSHLFKTLKESHLKKTLVFIAFGKEESGLVGSRAMTKTISKEQSQQYCAMVNIDSLGLAPPQVGDNMSSNKLRAFAVDVAKQLKIDLGHASISGADSDSTPFLEKKIPAITILGLTSNWRDTLHSNRDQVGKVNPVGVYLGYRLVLAMIARLDTASCDAYR
jgi:Peptidase family M28